MEALVTTVLKIFCNLFDLRNCKIFTNIFVQGLGFSSPFTALISNKVRKGILKQTSAISSLGPVLSTLDAVEVRLQTKELQIRVRKL